MSHRLWWNGALASVVLAGMAGIAATAAKSPAGDSAKSPTGLPLTGAVLKSTPLPMLTRDQLLTRGHAEDKLEIGELLYAYQFFHDTHNGDGVASLFVKDGTFEHLYNNEGKAIEPNPGPTGRGCMKFAPDDILKMYSNPIPFPTQSHNEVMNLIVQVHGDTATLYANVIMVRSNKVGGKAVTAPPNTAIIDHSSENVADLKRTSDGWRFTHLRVIQDFKDPAEAAAERPCAAPTH